VVESRPEYPSLHDIVGGPEGLPDQKAPETQQTLRATGTDDATVQSGQEQRSAQDAKPCLEGATGCDSEGDDSRAQKESPNPLRVADLSDAVRTDATSDNKRRARDSNPQPVSRHLISSEAASPEKPDENAHSRKCAAPGAAVGAQDAPIDADLADWLDACPVELTDEAKAGILAMVLAPEQP